MFSRIETLTSQVRLVAKDYEVIKQMAAHAMSEPNPEQPVIDKADAYGRLLEEPVIDYDPNIARATNPIVAWIATRMLWPAFRRLAKTGPLLLVHGEQSDIIEPATIARMKREAPHMKVAAIPRVGHAPMLTEPAARDAIAAFLRDAR